jgi:type I site-specific restriction endonuclease
MDQALDYAEAMDVPFVYTSNGDGFMEHDRTAGTGVVERELTLAEFPSPAALWQRLVNSKQIAPDVAEVVGQDYYLDRPGREPRYYQLVAINRTVEAIAQRPAAHPAGDGDGDGQDLHRLSDHLAAVESSAPSRSVSFTWPIATS